MTELDLIGRTRAELVQQRAAYDDIIHATANRNKVQAELDRLDKEQAAKVAEIDRLTVELTTLRDDYRTQFVGVLDQLDITAPVNQGPLVRHGATFALQWIALDSGLCGALGIRSRNRWDGLAQLELHAPQATRALLAANGGRLPRLTQEQQPWLADLARLRELVGPHVTAIGNGG